MQKLDESYRGRQEEVESKKERRRGNQKRSQK
jgi:hypothetical protein